MNKKFTAFFLMLVFCFSLQSFAIAIEEQPRLEEDLMLTAYQEVVDRINSQYGTAIEVYVCPPNMTVDEFEEALSNTARKSNLAKRQIQTIKKSNIRDEGDNITPLATDVKTGSYGKTADEWTFLYCRNVSVGYKENVGDNVFLSASKSNVRSTSGSQYTRMAYNSERGADIFDNGLTLYIWETCDLEICVNGVIIPFLKYPDYSASVYCTTSDKLGFPY